MKTLLATVAALAVASTAYGQELKIGVANMSDYIEPGTDHSNVGSQFYTNTFESLISKNPLKGEAEFNPSLATEWKMVTPQMMELKIREGVTFQNGDPMTMEDVLFSLQAMIKVTHDARIERSKEFFGNITRAEAVDDTTLRIYTKRPEPIFELVLASQQASIIPKKYLMGLTGHPEVDEPSDYIAFSKAPIGTGPYRIATFTPEEELIWERYDGYWGDQAPYEKISVRKIAELSPRITALLNGEVDIVTNVPPDQLDVIDNRPGFKTEGAVTPLFHIVFFGGAEDGEVITPELRRAMVRAIDRELLNEALWFGRAVVPNTHTYPQYGDYYTPDIMTFEYDLEEAKKIVAENGLEGTEITFVTHPTYYTNGLLAAQAMQEMWKEIGL
ncbi:MAG: ABC transporter substrate-binding protein, partial [Pseudomonadota bacterium]